MFATVQRHPALLAAAPADGDRLLQALASCLRCTLAQARELVQCEPRIVLQSQGALQVRGAGCSVDRAEGGLPTRCFAF